MDKQQFHQVYVPGRGEAIEGELCGGGGELEVWLGLEGEGKGRGGLKDEVGEVGVGGEPLFGESFFFCTRGR